MNYEDVNSYEDYLRWFHGQKYRSLEYLTGAGSLYVYQTLQSLYGPFERENYVNSDENGS